jgi:hypothetical protein
MILLHLFPSNVHESYILEQECSSWVHALTFWGQEMRHVLVSDILLVECSWEVHLTGEYLDPICEA